MIKKITILSVSAFFLLVLLKPNVIFAEKTKEYTVTTNEYEILKSLSKENYSNLKLSGYDEQEINIIRNIEKEYPKHLQEYKDLPEANLKQLGYSDDQVKLLKNYKGTEEETMQLAATMRFLLKDNYVNYSESQNKTEAKFYYRFIWNGIPLIKLKDIVGVSWNDWNIVNTSGWVNYYSITGDQNDVFSAKPTFIENENGPNTFGAGYKFDMTKEDNYYWARAGEGIFTVYNHGKKNLSVYAEYGHSTVFLNPSFSIPGLLSIEFSKSVKTMGSDHLDVEIP